MCICGEPYMNIILASKSPRRAQLLKLLDIDFETVTADIDETLNQNVSAKDEVARLSFEKAKAVFQKTGGESLIISADTVVEADGNIMGKPKDEQDAEKMLLSLSGRTHNVITAVTVMSKNRYDTRVVTTRVTFRKIDKDEILKYIKTKEPMDKAGGYGIQGKASKFVSRIEGDYYSVVGLPLCTLSIMLKDFDITV